MASNSKRYDREYFDKWYRGGGALAGADFDRQVALAVALAESVLAAPIRRVLDVGAGEGRWYPALARLRPRISYQGVEPSEWAVGRWGGRRNLVHGDLDSLPTLSLHANYDLVIVSDVLHYLPDAAVRRGLANVRPLVAGLLFAPTFTAHDEIEGDRVDFQHRSAEWYRRAFRAADLHQVGPWAWTTKVCYEQLADLECL